MSVDIVVGTQWGDEGKGKVVDSISKDLDYVVRFGGGNNAGHTVYVNNEKFVLHLLPSGVLYPHSTCILGSGVVVDPFVFLEEIHSLESRGFSTNHVFISERSHLIMPYHIILDEVWENEKGKNKIGTTKRGIGPCYADKFERIGLRVGDLLNPALFKERLTQTLSLKNKILTKIFDRPALSFNDIYESYMDIAEHLKKRIINSEIVLQEAMNAKKKILLEGAQAIMLDIDFGHYPYVTSSSPTAAGACVGSGISPKSIDKIIGVCKAYSTRVGEGPFVTESNEEGASLRNKGNEYGATTARPRRCGWLDLIALKYAISINGITDIALTKLDILSGYEKIPVCVGYLNNDKTITYIPSSSLENQNIRPIYEYLPGWNGDISACRTFESLPENAQNYILYIEKFCSCPVSFISTGVDRKQFIVRNP